MIRQILKIIYRDVILYLSNQLKWSNNVLYKKYDEDLYAQMWSASIMLLEVRDCINKFTNFRRIFLWSKSPSFFILQYQPAKLTIPEVPMLNISGADICNRRLHAAIMTYSFFSLNSHMASHKGLKVFASMITFELELWSAGQLIHSLPCDLCVPWKKSNIGAFAN